MISQLAHLNDDEKKVLFDAIPLITILIAGADGDIDAKELEWSAKVTQIRSYDHIEVLRSFYKQVETSFTEDLKSLLKQLPSDVKERTEIISTRLTKINKILPKLDPNYASRLDKSYRSFAKHVAKASGGVLGFASISRDEELLVDLPMINPIIFTEEEEEEE